MRFVSHNQKKDFWQRALVLISRTNSLTQTHALFLEWYCLQAARTAGRYADLSRCGGAHAAGGEGAHTEQAAQYLDDVSTTHGCSPPGQG